RFFVLFPATAGLNIEQNGVSTETPRNGNAATRSKKKSPRPRVAASPRHVITAHLMSLMQRGFTRLVFEGQQIDLTSPDDYQRDDFANVYVLVDRLVARADVRQRLVDSLETCFREGHGQAAIEVSGTHASGVPPEEHAGGVRTRERLRFSEKFECKYD